MDLQRIVVHSPGDQFQVILENVPVSITAKELITIVQNMEQFQKLKMNFRVKNGDNFYKPDELIHNEAYLINALDTISVAEKTAWKIYDILFYLCHFISFALLMEEKFQIAIITLILGLGLLAFIEHTKAIPDTFYGNIIDGVRLFFVSAKPNFNIESAAKPKN